MTASAGLKAREAILNPDELADCDSIFLTNSIRLIRPVTVFDEIPVPQNATAQVGSLLTALCEEIRHETGVDPRDADRVDP
jgi:branched-chain amino acid aminotransferase